MLDDAGNDGFCGLLFGEGGVEMIEILVIWIHEVYSGGVIDLIVALLHSLFVVYFIGPNFELFEALSKLDVIDTRPGHPDYVLSELSQIVLHDFWCVPFWIDRNED